MAAITAALIKQVREDTGAGMLDVKKALTEAEGDVARAKEIIRAKGIAAAGKREGRKAQEGTIASKVVETANGETGRVGSPKRREIGHGALAEKALVSVLPARRAICTKRCAHSP